MATVVLTDDHVLLRNGLATLVKNLGHTVLFQANNGKDFINQLSPDNIPDVVLLDINMPQMDGYETAQWLKQHYPSVKVLAISMYDSDNSIIRMLRSGAKGYILKDSDPIELQIAIESVMTKDFYYSDLISGKLIHALNHLDDKGIELNSLIQLNEREVEFLKYACSELTYKEMADKMCVSPRTVDGYRDGLLEKLQLKTRVGLAMYAIKNGIVTFQ